MSEEKVQYIFDKLEEQRKYYLNVWIRLLENHAEVNTDLRFLFNTLLNGHLGRFLFVQFLTTIAVNAMYT